MTRFLRHSRHWLILAVCLGGVGAYLGYSLHHEHETIEAVEREHLIAQSKVIEVNLTRQLNAINLSLEAIVMELPDWENRSAGRAEGVRHLKSLAAAMPSVLTFVVLDAQGTITLSNLDELIGRNFYQRGHFQAPLQSLNPNLLYLSPPFKSVLNNYVIALSRVVLDSEGKFAGVVVGTIDPIEMEILLNSVRYADDMRSMLLHGDGTIFVSQPALVDVIGKNVLVPASFFRQHLESKRLVSLFQGIAPPTADQRLAVLRTIQPVDLAMDKPLVVSLSRGWDALFASWQRDIRNLSAAYLLLAAMSALGLFFYQRSQARQGRIEERLKLATEAAGVGIWELDLKMRRYHWDSAMFDMFGLNPNEVNALNNDWQQLLLPGELQRMKEATRATIKQDQAFALTFQIQRKDGQVRFMRNRAALHFDAHGQPRSLVGTTEDVTERKQQEMELRIAAAAFDCQESIVVTDPGKVILRVNRAFTTLFGYTADEAIGHTPRLFKSGRHEQPFYAAMWERINRDGAWQGEIWNRKKNGDIFADLLSISAVLNDAGVVTHYVGTHVDITERKAAEAAIQKMAFHDALTGLPNRRVLLDRLQQALSKAKRNQKRLALLFVDLDQFKPVNDDFGHAVGDELLLAVAQRLQTCVRESDTVARMGGDEFVVLLPVIETVPDALGVAQKIHDALVQPFGLPEGHTVSISSSVGIAIYPDHGGDEAELIRYADVAMYQAKAAGRDRVVVYDPTAPV